MKNKQETATIVEIRDVDLVPPNAHLSYRVATLQHDQTGKRVPNFSTREDFILSRSEEYTLPGELPANIQVGDVIEIEYIYAGYYKPVFHSFKVK